MARTVRTNTYAITIPEEAQMSQHLDKLDVWIPAPGEDQYFLKFNIDTVVMGLNPGDEGSAKTTSNDEESVDTTSNDEESVVGERLAGTVIILDLKYDDGIVATKRGGARLPSIDRLHDDDDKPSEKVEIREYRINGWIEEGAWFADQARFVHALVLCSAPDHFHTISAYFPSNDSRYFEIFEQILESFNYRGNVQWLIEDERKLDAQFEQEFDATYQSIAQEEARGEDMLEPDAAGQLTVADLRKPRYHDEGYFEFRYAVPFVSNDLKCLLYEFTGVEGARSDEETHTMRQQFVDSLNVIASIDAGHVLTKLKQIMLDNYRETCELVDVAPIESSTSVDPANPLGIQTSDEAWAYCEIDEAYLSMDNTRNWGGHLFASLHLFPRWDSGHGTVVVFRDGEIAGVVESEAHYSEFVLAG